MKQTSNADAGAVPCDFVAVPRAAVEWLKAHFPALTEKAGMCERIGGRLYTKTTLAPTAEQPEATAKLSTETVDKSVDMLSAPIAEQADEAVTDSEPVAEWQSRYMGDPRQPGYWNRSTNPAWAKAVYEGCANHIN